MKTIIIEFPAGTSKQTMIATVVVFCIAVAIMLFFILRLLAKSTFVFLCKHSEYFATNYCKKICISNKLNYVELLNMHHGDVQDLRLFLQCFYQ